MWNEINNRSNFSRHKKYCGKEIAPVPCIYCNSTFTRKDDMLKHVCKFHSEAAKRKAEESAELLKLELLNSNKVPRLSVDDQTGGAVTTRGMKCTSKGPNPEVKVAKNDQEIDQTTSAVSTRGMKRTSEEPNPDVKAAKNDQEIDVSDTYEGEPNPLLVADVKKLGPAKRWKQNVVVNQKFIMTLDQQRPAKGEVLNIGATHAIAAATDNLIEDLKSLKIIG